MSSINQLLFAEPLTFNWTSYKSLCPSWDVLQKYKFKTIGLLRFFMMDKYSGGTVKKPG